MSLSLPSIYLYHLTHDNLPPEEFERIVSSHRAWLRICREYVFDDGHNTSRYIINMREGRTVHHRTPSRGIREKEKLEKMVLAGDVVMLSDIYGPANLFHINQEGALICTHPLAFHFEGAKKIIAQYDQSVRKRDYRTRGGKPRPTPTHQFKRGESPIPERSMLSRATDESGRVLSAKWQSLSDSAKTVWEATPFTHDEATTEAARGRIADGAIGTLEGLTTLMGPSSEDYMAGAFNPELAAINKARQENQQAAVEAIYDSTKGAVTDAYDRNGLAGAAAMVATTSVTELAGTKGLGTVEKVGTLGDVAKLGKAVELKKLDSYLGTYKGKSVLLQNIDVVKMDYIKRNMGERIVLRNQFNAVRKKFLKSIADNPEVKKRLNVDELANLANGSPPRGWEVHHKLPLDDSGSNDFSNLVLISKTPEHSVLTSAQQKISRNIAAGGSTEILWPTPKGIIYP